MHNQFVLIIKEHRVLGALLQPYLIEVMEGRSFFRVTDMVTPGKVKELNFQFTESNMNMIDTAFQFSDEVLLRKFSKKRVSASDFIEKMDPEYFKKVVRPYIDKKIDTIIKYYLQNPCDLYFMDQRGANLFPGEKLNFIKDQIKFHYSFKRDEEGVLYGLKVSLMDKTLDLTKFHPYYLSLHPCLILVGDCLIYTDEIDGMKLKPFFKKSEIRIHKKFEQKYFEVFIKNTLVQNDIEFDGFNVIYEEGNCIPILKIEKDLVGEYGFQIHFRYNNSLIYPDHKNRRIVELYEEFGYEYRVISRSFEQENTYLNFLNNEYLKEEGNGFYKFVPDGEYTDLLQYLSSKIEDFEDIGFVIEQEKSNTFFIGLPELDLAVSEEGDWFDLKGKVKFGGFEVPFSRLKRNIIQRIREFELPDGSIGLIPTHWFDQYEDLFALSSGEAGRIKLKRHHYALIGDFVPDNLKIYKKVFDNNTSDLSVPETINANLRSYQIEGYRWMNNLGELNLGACLADDMGLGKTLQTITLVEKFRTDPTRKAIAKGKPKLSTQISLFDTQNSDEEDGFEYQTPSIIVMPTSLLHNWRMEMKKFAPHLNVLIHYGPERTRNVRNFDFYDVVLTSYGVIRNDINWLRNYKFNLLILDESQFIKNPTSKNYKSLLTLESFQRVILTGTPIENSLKDLWAQMNFINPGVLGSLNLFQNRFISPIEKSGDEETYLKLRTLIHPFILRRTKEEVAKDLPPVQNFVEYCEMNESQKELYEKEKAKARNFLMREVKRNGIESSAMVVLRALIRLRQIAIHPELIDEKGLGSGKFEMIKEKIKVVLSEDHNLLIFSSFVKHLDLLQSFLEEERIPYSILKGDTLNREQVIEEFNREDSKKVFLISIKAGGFGLNLTKADYVFITDPWWNPAVEEQAISRAHRIGQTRNVFVYRFISQASIEEKIVKLQERKKELADQLINSDNVLKDLNYSDLESLFS